MRKSRFTDEQIALAILQTEAGTPVKEICHTRRERADVLSVTHENERRLPRRGGKELREMAYRGGRWLPSRGEDRSGVGARNPGEPSCTTL